MRYKVQKGSSFWKKNHSVPCGWATRIPLLAPQGLSLNVARGEKYMVPPGETFQRGAVILRKHWRMTDARCEAMVWGGREVGREKSNTEVTQKEVSIF